MFKIMYQDITKIVIIKFKLAYIKKKEKKMSFFLLFESKMASFYSPFILFAQG